MTEKQTRTDLLTVLLIVVVFAISLGFLKYYDSKTNNVAQLGQKLVDRLVQK